MSGRKQQPLGSFMDRHTGFREIVDPLLLGLAPPNGACALVLRHPIGAAYFPLAVACGRKTECWPGAVMEDYHLFATRLPSGHEQSVQVFSDASDVSTLVLSGKLAVTLFTSGDVRQQAFGCANDGSIYLLMLSPSDTERGDTVHPTAEVCRALGATVNVWQRERRSAPSIDAESPRHLIANLNTFAADKSPDPPYVPILHSRVGWRSGTRGGYSYTEWATNSLAYNCYLLAHYPDLMEDYITAMFLHESGHPESVYWDKGPRRSRSPLARAIADVCIDLVHPTAMCIQNGVRWTAFVRRNIPTAWATATVQERVRSEARDSGTSPWRLVRTALDHLKGEHPDSALVTAWVGSADPGTKPTIIPIGVVEGALVNELAKAAESPQLESQRRMYPNAGKRLLLETITLDRLPSNEREATDQMLATVLERSSMVLQMHLAPFPGPYRMVINEHIVRIHRRDGGSDARELTKQKDKMVWSFLKLLAIRSGNGGRATHDEVCTVAKECHVKLTGNIAHDSRTIAQRVASVLRRTTGGRPVDPACVYESEYGQGYALVKDCIVECVADESDACAMPGSTVTKDGRRA